MMRRFSATEAEDRDYTALAQVRAYWEALRDGVGVPARARIDPRGIEDALSRCFVLERVAPGLARFRIAGMHLTDLMGMDVRGMPVSAMIDPSARATFGQALEQVFAGPAVLEMDIEAERGIGRPALCGRVVMLPLADETGRTGLALGALATHGGIGRGPRRFFTARARILPLGGASLRVATGVAPAPVRPPRAAPGRSHLRLVASET